MVHSNVPDYALMLGVPAKQRGWMSRHGHVLKNPDADGIMVCPESGLRYKLAAVDSASLIVDSQPKTNNYHRSVDSNHQLVCLDLDEESPLPEELAVGKVVYDELKKGNG